MDRTALPSSCAAAAVVRRAMWRATLRPVRWAVAALVLAATAANAPAASAAAGGLYIAGDGFSFNSAAERALAHNPRGQRFVLLVLPREAAALGERATPSQRRLRDRVRLGGGVLLVCQRDLDNGRIAAAGLLEGVVPVRGWPAAGERSLAPGQRTYANEDAALLPASNEALRRLRATCS